MIDFERGTVWWIELPLDTQSHVQGGARPCVIVSNHLEHSGVITVCPLSTKLDNIATHPKVFVKKEGQVLIEQITTVDISNIGNYVGKMRDDDIKAVNEALKAHLLSQDETDIDCKVNATLFPIKRELRQITKMLEFLMWKDGHNNDEKDL